MMTDSQHDGFRHHRDGIFALFAIASLPLPMRRHLAVVNNDGHGATSNKVKNDGYGAMSNDVNDDGKGASHDNINNICDGATGGEVDGDCNGTTGNATKLTTIVTARHDKTTTTMAMDIDVDDDNNDDNNTSSTMSDEGDNCRGRQSQSR